MTLFSHHIVYRRHTCLLLLTAVLWQTRAFAAGPKPTVTIMKIQSQEISDRIVYPARISAFRAVAVPAETDGIVQKLAISIGQRIKAGEPLLRISNPDPVYDYKPFTISAPFAGVVSSIEVSAGDRISRGKTLLTLADSSSIKILIQLTAKDLGKLTLKYPGQLQIGKIEIPVQIKAMSPIIDDITGTAPCELELAKPSEGGADIVVGSIGKVRFTINPRKAWLLPERTIVFRGKDPFVVGLSSNAKAKYLPVTIRKQSNGLVEIDGELQNGETIIASSQGYIAEGEEVSIQNSNGR